MSRLNQMSTPLQIFITEKQCVCNISWIDKNHKNVKRHFCVSFALHNVSKLKQYAHLAIV